MPSVLDRSALEQSPLADLHLLANELGVDGFRRLRKPELVDAILARQSGDEPEPEPEPEPSRARGAVEPAAERGRRPRSARAAAAAAGAAGAATRRATATALVDRDEPAAEAPRARGQVVEGTVELLANGSGFLRLSPPEPTDDDVYISAAQVKRCELVSGDKIGGPDARAAALGALPVADPRRHDQRPPGRRGRRGHPLRGPAGGVAGRAHRARLAGPDGERDRVADAVRQGLAGGHRRPVALGQDARRCGGSPSALAAREGLEVSAVLAGVRPEEVADWPVDAERGADVLGLGRRAGPGRRAGGRDTAAASRPAAATRSC